jgi:hypothetical protein
MAYSEVLEDKEKRLCSTHTRVENTCRDIRVFSIVEQRACILVTFLRISFSITTGVVHVLHFPLSKLVLFIEIITWCTQITAIPVVLLVCPCASLDYYATDSIINKKSKLKSFFNFSASFYHFQKRSLKYSLQLFRNNCFKKGIARSPSVYI